MVVVEEGSVEKNVGSLEESMVVVGVGGCVGVVMIFPGVVMVVSVSVVMVIPVWRMVVSVRVMVSSMSVVIVGAAVVTMVESTDEPPPSDEASLMKAEKLEADEISAVEIWVSTESRDLGDMVSSTASTSSSLTGGGGAGAGLLWESSLTAWNS